MNVALNYYTSFRELIIELEMYCRLTKEMVVMEGRYIYFHKVTSPVHLTTKTHVLITLITSV